MVDFLCDYLIGILLSLGNNLFQNQMSVNTQTHTFKRKKYYQTKTKLIFNFFVCENFDN